MFRRFLKGLWAGWMKFAHVLGIINRSILLSVFYFVFVNLIHLGLRIFRVDLLDRRMRPSASYWHERSLREPGLYPHQF